jgi:hypothetical protein
LYHALESFLEIGRENQLQEVLSLVSRMKQEPESYQQVFMEVKKLLRERLEEYESEGRVLELLVPTLRLDYVNWWTVWSELVLEFTWQRQVKAGKQIWQMWMAEALQGLDSEVKGLVRKLSKQVQQTVREHLRADFAENPEVWLEWAITTQDWEFFEENLEVLDPQTLLRYAAANPDRREELETLIKEQIKVWVDFLPTGEYQELVDTVQQWRRILGQGEALEDVLDYIKSLHGKKTKLMQKLGIRKK